MFVGPSARLEGNEKKTQAGQWGDGRKKKKPESALSLIPKEHSDLHILAHNLQKTGKVGVKGEPHFSDA